MSAGMSMPVSPLTVAFASATVRVTVLTTSDAPSFERTVSVVDVAERFGGRADDLGQHRQDGLDDRRLVELAIGLGAQREGLGLGLALGERDAGLGVALEGRPLRLGLGVDRHDPGLRLALGDGDGGLGGAGQLDPFGLGLGLRDAGALLALGAADLRLGIGLGRSDGAGQQLLLLARGFQLGQLGLLAGDLLGRLGLGQRPGLGGARLGGGVCVSVSARRSETSRAALILICSASASRTAASWSAAALAIRASRSRRAVSCWPISSM